MDYYHKHLYMYELLVRLFFLKIKKMV
jgi:hypothetical protein